MSRWSRDLGAVKAEEIDGLVAGFRVEPTADELALARLEADGKIPGDTGRRTVDAKNEANSHLDEKTMAVAAAMAKAGVAALGEGSAVSVHMHGVDRLDGDPASGTQGYRVLVAVVTVSRAVPI